MFNRGKDDDEESTAKDLAKGAAKTVAAAKVIDAVKSDEDEEKSGGKGKFLALILAGAGVATYFWRKRRDRQQDEVQWDEPRPL